MVFTFSWTSHAQQTHHVLEIIPRNKTFREHNTILGQPCPILAARLAAINLPFSERRAMIFSLLLPVFLLPFEVFSLLFTIFSLLCTTKIFTRSIFMSMSIVRYRIKARLPSTWPVRAETRFGSLTSFCFGR